jgi:hypothetical protein
MDRPDSIDLAKPPAPETAPAAAPVSFADLITRWPSHRAMAEDLDIAVNRIEVWKHRNSIPAGHWRLLVKAAERRGIAGITFDHLAGLAERRVPRGASA